MNKAIDQSVRHEALDPSQSFIVQAPAGSGKTELLTQRYLKLLSTVEQPEAIIALTFTKKAAAEMRARILAALRSANSPAPNQSTHALQTWKLARAALRQDQKNKWYLSQYSSRMKIQTIDAFASTLANARPILSEGNSLLRIAADPNQLYQMAARQVIAYLNDDQHPWFSSLAKIVRHLDVNLFKVERLFMSILNKREQWLPYMLDSNLLNHIRRSLHSIISETLTPLINLDEALKSEWLAIYYHSCENLKIDPIESNHDELIDLAQWQAMIHLFLKKDGAFRKTLTKKQGFLAVSSIKDPEEKEKQASYKESAFNLMSALKDEPGQHKILQEVILLPHFSDLKMIEPLIEAIAAILPLLMIELQAVIKSKQEIDFNEVTQLALNALGSIEMVSDLQLKLDYQIQHILIDEFQDTSISQYRLIQKLTHGWEVSDGRTLFFVGDPMQSIYRFRQAEVGLFLNVQQGAFKQIKIKPLYLKSNFRSSTTIVEWLNQTFSKLLPEQAIPHLGAVPYNQTYATHTNLGNVDLHFFEDFIQEEFYLIEQIKQQHLQKNTTAILVRSRTHLTTLVQHLYQENISFYATELNYLIDHPLCLDLLSLAKALCQPHNTLAWLALLRTPFCGLSLETIYYLSQHIQGIFYQHLCDIYEILPIQIEEKNRIKAFIKIIKPYQNNLKHIPLANTLDLIFRQCFYGSDVFFSEQNLAIAEQFFNLIENFENGFYIKDWIAFENKLAQTRIQAPLNPQTLLQIMTIHKSKGLEFDTVILPFLSKRSGKNMAEIMSWTELTNQKNENLFMLAPIKNHYADSEPFYDYLNYLSKMKSHYELQRLFYVACSRAKFNLFLTATLEVDDSKSLKPPTRSTLLYLIWDQIDPEIHFKKNKKPPTHSPLTDTPASFDYQRIPLKIYQTLADANIKPVENKSERVKFEFNWQSQVGTFVHKIFSEILFYDADELAAYKIQLSTEFFKNYLIQQTLFFDIPSEQKTLILDQIITAIYHLIESNIGQWFFQQNEKIGTEYEIRYKSPKTQHMTTAYIDFIFYEKPYIWIVDHKIIFEKNPDYDQVKATYQKQLESYAYHIQQQDHRPIRLALYLPLQNKLIQWEAMHLQNE